MTYIAQKQLENLGNLVQPGKVVVVYGTRRVGKTTLVKKYLEAIDANVLFVDAGFEVIHRENYLQFIQ